MKKPAFCKGGRLIILIVSMLGIAYLMSPLSYFFVSFHQPLTPAEYVDFLKENGIDPQYHRVYVLRSALTSFENIGRIDGMDMSGRMIKYTVFNTKPYAIKALFDKRVESWRFAGPENPCDW